jgi:3-methylfumaryl-CoA hydratase
VRTLGPLHVGSEATRVSTVTSTETKTGRSGRMTFVTVHHEVRQSGQVCVQEQQHIVYREPPIPNHAAPVGNPATDPVAGSGDAAPAGQPGDWQLDTSPTLLARYSALTYNGHRIHYDRDFARDVEGYPGLLVHGPLQAVAMAEAARRLDGGRVRAVTFDYRLVAPLFDHQGMIVRADADEATDGISTSVHDRSGRPTATGRYHDDRTHTFLKGWRRH